MKLVETQGDSLSQEPKLEKVTGLNVKVAKRKSGFSLTVGLIFLFYSFTLWPSPIHCSG